MDKSANWCGCVRIWRPGGGFLRKIHYTLDNDDTQEFVFCEVKRKGDKNQQHEEEQLRCLEKLMEIVPKSESVIVRLLPQ